MKFVEFAGGIIMPTSNEEYDLIEKISAKSRWPISELDQREKHVARNLITKGMIDYKKQDNKTYIIVNDLQTRSK